MQAVAGPPFVSNAEDQASVRSTTIPLESPESYSRYERVLILDGDTRSALAATRSLGRRGVPVVVAGETARTLAGASKYCGESFTYPSPTANLRSFLSTVKAECSRRGIRVIFPMTDISMASVLKHQEEFKDFQLPFAGFPAFEKGTDGRVQNRLEWNAHAPGKLLSKVESNATHITRCGANDIVGTAELEPDAKRPCRSQRLSHFGSRRGDQARTAGKH